MSLRRRFLLLTALRWLPTGLVIPVMALLPLHRGMTVAEMGAALAVQGIVVLCLELPTGGLADTLGRRPLFALAAALALSSYLAFAVAGTPLTLALAAALSGIFRALDSGALNAWFVDQVHASTAAEDHDRSVTSGLGAASGAIGGSIATGSLLSAGLVAWAPWGATSALVLPFLAAAALSLAQIVATGLLMHEPPRHRVRPLSPVRDTALAVREGIGLLAGSRVLRALVAVELFWGFGMVSFETLMPVRLAELVGDADRAAAVMGPVVAAGWAAGALGAAALPRLSRRWGLVPLSVALRIVQGATVVAMGLAWGRWGSSPDIWRPTACTWPPGWPTNRFCIARSPGRTAPRCCPWHRWRCSRPARWDRWCSGRSPPGPPPRSRSASGAWCSPSPRPCSW